LILDKLKLDMTAAAGVELELFAMVVIILDWQEGPS
jgi:hypothetical protein